MSSAIISIEVDPDTARAFSTATAEDRAKLQLLLRLRLRDLTTRIQRPLIDIVKEVGQEAEQRGLTPEVLESLLDER